MWIVAFALLTLVLAGDAAFGDNRPLLERQWKGVAAALLGLALAVELWRRHRERRGSGSGAPVHPSPRIDSRGNGAGHGARPPEPAALPGSARAAGEAIVVAMPDLGQGDDPGTVTRWRREIGEMVDAGEPLVEISTDKVDTELPAPASGVLVEIRVDRDETAPAGAPLAVLRVRQRDATDN